MFLPYEKVCIWLTDKNSDFQKGIDCICKFLSTNNLVVEYLISKSNENQVLLPQWIPIINTLVQIAKDPADVLKTFIKHIPQEWNEILEDDDRKADQIRIYSVVAHHAKKYNLFDPEVFPESSLILTHFINQINEYSYDKHPVFVKYECLSLIGIIYNIQAPMKKVDDNAVVKPKIIGEVIQH